MLVQFHHHFKDDTTDMRTQKEVKGHDELKRFFEDTAKKHPLPGGAVWLVAPEDSPRFWRVPA